MHCSNWWDIQNNKGQTEIGYPSIRLYAFGNINHCCSILYNWPADKQWSENTVYCQLSLTVKPILKFILLYFCRLCCIYQTLPKFQKRIFWILLQLLWTKQLNDLTQGYSSTTPIICTARPETVESLYVIPKMFFKKLAFIDILVYSFNGIQTFEKSYWKVISGR